MNRTNTKAFTLAELLIALGILGVIATFTIPKVLMAQQSGQKKAVAKEAAAMISGAHTVLKLNSTLTGASTIMDLTPYLNYVRVETAGSVDGIPAAATGYPASYTCNTASIICLRLHNGSVLIATKANSFGGTASTNAFDFVIDPDGTLNSDRSSVGFLMYYSGQITSRSTVRSSTQDGGGQTYNPGAGMDPGWFDWN
jgi:prepilin-type N-terminal cleavage/methylation domain-containing protein